ncbi:hypothetical protein [Clostridium saccharobutylicum]|uniref:hypothetical protein n=1 Tax=Clostridium saccharobutylicum TaxID=169679 RepID=UPI0007E1247E|nr:hypothetical protein [Clostridium saccharobutylicum]OAV41498.1 hypothetical protein M945_1040 [Clostridium saccharobutylicum DSM 13864]
MKKNKILGIVVASIIAMSSVVPAFADDNTSQNSATNVTTIQAKFTKKAAKLGVDITGLSAKDAKGKIEAAEASKLGIDTAGLSNKEIQAKIKSAMEAKELANLTEKASKLGIDITGLSNQDAKTKIENAVASKLGIDTTGLTNKQIQEKIKEMKSNKITNADN